MTDEQMQEIIDKNHSRMDDFSNDIDMQSYSLLFDALKQEPAIPLRYNFAGKVTEKIHAKKSRATELKLYVLLGFVFIILMAGSFVYLSGIDGSPASQFAQALVKYRWMLAFGIAALLMIQFLDKKFVRTG